MPRTILVSLFGDLGDTILTIPALRAVRNRYPDARIVLLGKSVAADYATGLRLVDECIVVDKHAFDRPASLFSPSAWLSLATLLFRLRRRRPDTVLIFHHLPTLWGSLKFALLSLASGAQCRLGLDNGRGWFLTKAVRDRGFGALHEAEYWLQVAELLDATGPLKLEAPITDDDRVRANRLLPSTELFGVHPGTGLSLIHI